MGARARPGNKVGPGNEVEPGSKLGPGIRGPGIRLGPGPSRCGRPPQHSTGQHIVPRSGYIQRQRDKENNNPQGELLHACRSVALPAAVHMQTLFGPAARSSRKEPVPLSWLHHPQIRQLHDGLPSDMTDTQRLHSHMHSSPRRDNRKGNIIPILGPTSYQ